MRALTIYLISLAVFCPLHYAQAQERELSLQDAVAAALKNHPRVRVAEGGAQASEAEKGAAFAGFLPTLTFDATYMRATGNQVPTPGPYFDISTSRSGKSYNYFLFSLTLHQNIWDFGRTLGAYRAAQAQSAASNADISVSRAQVWERVVNAYHGVWAAQKMVEVAGRLRDQARRVASKARELYEAGAKPRIDVTRTEVAATMAEAGYNAAVEAWRLACSRLFAAMGEGEYDVVRVKEPPLPESEPLKVEEAVAEALSRRPEYEAALQRLKAAHAELTRVRGDYFPRLFAFGSASEAGVRLDDLVWNWSVGIGLSYPIFSGLGTRQAVRAQEARIEAAKASLEVIELDVRSEIYEAHSRVKEALARLGPARVAVAAARETMTLAEERYRLGQADQLEVLDAQTILAQAEAALIRTEYDLAVAWTGFWKAIGKLPGADADD